MPVPHWRARQPLTVVDIAHNEDGLRTVRTMLERTPYRRLHLVLGTVNDKDLGRMLAMLPREARYYFCKADIPRGLDAEELRTQAARHGLHGTVHSTVKAALEAARSAAGDEDLVLVTGSAFVVAEVV